MSTTARPPAVDETSQSAGGPTAETGNWATDPTPRLTGTGPATRADVAAQCARIAVRHLSAQGHLRSILTEAANHLDAAQHLLPVEIHYVEQATDVGLRWAESSVAAARYVRTALFLTEHVFALPAARSDSWETGTGDVMGRVLVTLAAGQLRNALTQLEGLERGPSPKRTRR
ncbi:hypothetical protein ACQEVC_34560 [Plantactinospora sp. CA-294935]|uniref:hypothetical protein n=1 Tax=Plantactinospora sp. CA-294935 TaxID=3240012 RepID=UPI003D91C12B